MWKIVCCFILLSLSSECSSTSYVYKYTQAKAVTPANDNTSSADAATSSQSPTVTSSPLGAQSSLPIGLDTQVLQDVFGLPSAFANAVPGKDTIADYFKPSYEPYDDFDWKLTKQVASTSEDNLLLSPLGLKLALAILTEAATGITAAELQFTLGLDSNATVVRTKFESMLGSLLTKSDQYILDLGSRIYVGKRTEPRQKFAATALENYKTEVVKADFDRPAEAVLDINSWISNLTHERIPKLVSESDVSSAVMLVLNTLYFKGAWKHQFDPNDTRIDNFYVTPAKMVPVPFMTMENNFYYVESARMQAKILRMPYLGNKFSMYLIVPNSVTGLTRTLQELTSQQLRQEINFLNARKVRLTLPRFQFEYGSQLDGVLRDLGIRHAFEQTASFPGISRGEGTDMIRISRVMQKSGIEVNELGSVVYSATEVALVNRFGDEDDGVVEVRANKPFLFYIEDETTRQLLFTGRISNPALPTVRVS